MPVTLQAHKSYIFPKSTWPQLHHHTSIDRHSLPVTIEERHQSCWRPLISKLHLWHYDHSPAQVGAPDPTFRPVVYGEICCTSTGFIRQRMISNHLKHDRGCLSCSDEQSCWMPNIHLSQDVANMPFSSVVGRVINEDAFLTLDNIGVKYVWSEPNKESRNKGP